MAIDKGHSATVEVLIKAGANLDLQNQVSDSRSSIPQERSTLWCCRRQGGQVSLLVVQMS